MSKENNRPIGKNLPNLVTELITRILNSRVARFFLAQNTKTRKIYQNDHKIHQMATKYMKWQKNRQDGYKIYLNLPLQDPPKFYQIWFFGLKTNHLATLLKE
jgi:hypothetical protein